MSTFRRQLMMGAVPRPVPPSPPEPPTPVLPDGYKQVEYIYASGNSYIDTEFTPNQDTSIELQAKIVSRSGSFIGVFGTETPRFSLYINNSTSSSPKARFDYGDSMTTATEVLSNNVDYTFKIDKNKFYINDSLVGEVTATTFTASRSIYLFTVHNSSGAYGTYGKNIHWVRCKIKNDGTLAEDWISCKRTSDGKYGMYDVVRNVFRGSYTTTNFAGGSEV